MVHVRLFCANDRQRARGEANFRRVVETVCSPDSATT